MALDPVGERLAGVKESGLSSTRLENRAHFWSKTGSPPGRTDSCWHAPAKPLMKSQLTAGKQRLYLFAGLVLVWLLVIGCRLVWLQVLRYGEFSQRAARQQQRTIEVAPRRGIIYDRNGRELAMSLAVDSIFAVPSEIPDPAGAAGLLGKVLNSDPREILTRLKSSRAFCWIARKVDAETANRVRALNLHGLYFQKEPKRFYPKRELAAQVIGYVGLDDEGLGGLERAFEARLRGKPGRMLISLDAKRRWFGRVEREPEAGESLVLTLDEKVQYIAERELDAAMRQTRAEAGTVIVQNPATGEILALANRPSFNPNLLPSSDAGALKNRAVSDVYEPGSTFKIVTLAGALEEKLTRPEEVIDCQMGEIMIGGWRIRDHRPFGALTVSQVMAQSSDVGAIKLGLRLGEQRFDRYIRAFGFGATTGIELPGETRGLTRPASRWSKVSIGAISMGQEIAVSPLQLASMISTIANDGQWTPPRVVAATRAPGEAPPVASRLPPAEQRRVISPLTALQLKRMLEGVVLFGTGRKAILNGYSSAGKTGTAQKTDPATGAYSRWKYVASFAGFAPVNQPAVTILVILDSPLDLHEGGQVAAPVFARIAQPVLAYLQVPHDAEIQDPRRLLLRAAVKEEDVAESAPQRVSEGRERGGQEAPMSPPAEAASRSDSTRGDFRQATLTFAGMPLQAVAPSRRRSRQRARFRLGETPAPPGAAPESPATSGGTVVVDLEGGITVPSLLGKPVRAAIESAQEAGLEIDVIGSGIARQQSPPPGSHIPAGARVEVRFAR